MSKLKQKRRKAAESGLDKVVKMNNNFAVFESIGEDWEQHSVWMNEPKVLEFIDSCRTMYPDKYFYILQKHTGETNVL